tara:strand:- start:256 stop:360 length:105 start_codon:yes stop_codon:yes gene_type:complete
MIRAVYARKSRVGFLCDFAQMIATIKKKIAILFL